jgi:periplasmic protein TonB
VLHLDVTGPDTPRLPQRRLGALGQIGISALAHAAGVATLVVVLGHSITAGLDTPPSIEDEPCVDVSHIVFQAPRLRDLGGGGGGGGNHEQGPLRRAEGAGPDAITLRAAPPAATPSPTPRPDDVAPPLPSIVIDAVPLASGVLEQTGVPSMSAPLAGSAGPGSGGGIGSGRGTGIGPGQGPGLGPGSGGGTGGGVYRVGGPVTAPRVIKEVRPNYTNGALLRHLQGTVELEAVVTRDGLASQIRVVRSLDPGGLDEEAIAAVKQWRFEPARYGGAPVDVLVVILLDFLIR